MKRIKQYAAQLNLLISGPGAMPGLEGHTAARVGECL